MSKKDNEIKELSLSKIKEKINEKYKYREHNKALALTIYNELDFMQKTLIRLKKEIENNGVIENFKNGTQDFIRESQALKSYNTTLKSYNKNIIDLYTMLNKEEQPWA